jgi:hypothetical protein
VARDRLPDWLTLAFKLGANGGADEIRAIGIKSFLHQEIDLAEVDEAEIDRDLFAIDSFRSKLWNLRHLTIPSPSAWMHMGWFGRLSRPRWMFGTTERCADFQSGGGKQ